mgnify:FL=1
MVCQFKFYDYFLARRSGGTTKPEVEKEIKSAKILKVDLSIPENAKDHHTDK